MTMLQYNRGEFSDFNGLPECGDDEDFVAWLERAGFSPMKTGYGNDGLGGFDVFESRKSDTFFVDVCWDGCTCRQIFLPDFPSLLMFLRDFGPVFQLSALRFDIEEMKEMMVRTFRKEHGHDSRSVCKDCDPLEFYRRMAQGKR